jgi:MYXO-CTERM domain-containing protein
LCREGYCVRGGGFSNGERCAVAEDCGSFLCAAFNYPELNYCTKLCPGGTGCPIGFACKNELGAEHCVPTDFRLGDECIADSQCLSGRCDEGLGVCIRKCDPKTTPCPPGFACHVYGGELACVPAAVAASVDGGLPGVGGFSGGGGGPGGSSGASGSAQAGAAGGAQSDSSGCGCRVAPSPSRSLWLLTLPALLVLGRRQRRR